MDQILHEASREVEVIILDSPPSLVTDFQVLAAKVDGVFLVIRPGYTHAGVALSTHEQLNRVNAKILGVVLNKIPKSGYYHGGYYQYLYPYTDGWDYYQRNEDPKLQPNLQVERRPVNLLPPSESQEIYIGSEVYLGSFKTFKKFYSGKRPNEHIYIPSEDIPSSRNVTTKPKTHQDEIQIVFPGDERTQAHVRTEFDAWYIGQADNQEGDEQ